HYRPSRLHTFIFFISPPPPDLYTLSLHDALPIYFFPSRPAGCSAAKSSCRKLCFSRSATASASPTAIATVVLAVGARLSEHGKRSEEHTSELQSRGQLVCRLLLEKKNRRT